ncbi:MAG TPA: YbaK/EbsC family protein [Chloroflexi bacterium]|nr:YbaK/EbsC family protein [Chloroflexota bacterium]
MTPLPPSAQRVQQTLQDLGCTCRVIEMPVSTRTAAEAAEAVGCQVGQIAKSLVFKTRKSKRPILVITSGANRVDVKHMRQIVGEKLGKADADFVRESTGYAIGGVPPVGHAHPLETYIDRDLLQYEHIWAAAGTPRALFRIAPQELVRISGGKVVAVG